MELTTQKTPHEAATLIQARVRGHQQRSRQQRATTAIIKLQARQRGSYTRREYQKLLDFYNEQESFLAESKRRQLRLWHREQELYFLQHTTADELDRIRHFQYTRSARMIQREWKKRHPTMLEDVDVSGLGRPFDPFGLIAGPPKNQDQEHCTREQSWVLSNELFGELPTGKTPVFSLDPERLARRRAEIHDKIQRLRKDQHRGKQQQQLQQTPHTDKSTRRELFDTLVTLRAETARRLEVTRETYRATRKQRDLEAAQLSASCRNRLAFLQDETRIQMLLSTTASATATPAARVDAVRRERCDFEESTATWSDERKQRAWHNHTRVVQSVLCKTQWYETYIAGEKQDIRRVYADSPWDHTKQVWQWPALPLKASRDAKSTDGTTERTTNKSKAVKAMDRFKFGLEATECGDENTQDNQSEELLAPIEDGLASCWWRAHATQSHFSYSRQRSKQWQQQSQHHRSVKSQDNQHVTSAEQDALVTPEMLVNPQFYELYKKTIAANSKNELVSGVETRASRLQRQIQQKVVDIEAAIDENTRIIVEKASAAQQQQARKTREEIASIQIQRHVRGKIGRKRAQDHLAEYFVLVRGRAIRKGRCEECGEAPAVLECKQCEESLHFCPICWVQVHSTRRRKAHVAIPMAAHAVATAAASVAHDRADALGAMQRLDLSAARGEGTIALPTTRMPVPETTVDLQLPAQETPLNS